MQITKPAYFDSFCCVAGACPDSCCHQWAVVVDEASAARYQALAGDLGQRLREVLAQEDGDTILTLQPDGRCPMWQADGLCRIQAELGEGALCQTCRQFPRLRHDYGDFVELGLELSCPEAALLILGGDATPLSHTESGGDEPDYDADLMDILLTSRESARALMARKDLTVPEALAVLLLYGHRVQAQLDGGEEAVPDPAGALALARQLPLAPYGDILEFCGELNILTERWRGRLVAPLGGAWTEEYRALGRYFIDRYWLQAVADGDLISRVKLTVFACLVLRQLGGELLPTAQLMSKELENDAENIDAILDGAYDAPALTDANLLYLLLEVTP